MGCRQETIPFDKAHFRPTPGPQMLAGIFERWGWEGIKLILFGLILIRAKYIVKKPQLNINSAFAYHGDFALLHKTRIN
jgi:hypothetical protein